MGVSAAPVGGIPRASVSGGMRSLFILLLFHFLRSTKRRLFRLPPSESRKRRTLPALAKRVEDCVVATPAMKGVGDGRRCEVMCDVTGQSATVGQLAFSTGLLNADWLAPRVGTAAIFSRAESISCMPRATASRQPHAHSATKDTSLLSRQHSERDSSASGPPAPAHSPTQPSLDKMVGPDVKKKLKQAKQKAAAEAGAYTRPLFSST